MKISGYSVEERFNAIKGSVLRMEEMRKKVSDGEIESVNRKKSEIIQQKIDKGGITSSSWFLRGNTYYVISCQPTPGGILAKKLNERVNAINPTKRILVKKDRGSPTISSLKKSDPFRLPTCRFSDPRCIVEMGETVRSRELFTKYPALNAIRIHKKFQLIGILGHGILTNT